jgi:uncharacterized protein YlxP (DUF503 family)
MLIGLATLISVLFFGGVNEYFLVNKLEKGVKKYVVEKERKKEITAELKNSKKFIKAFNKERKNEFKLFKVINADRETTKEEMNQFFDQLIKERRDFQKIIIQSRIEICGKINPDEWESILELSRKSVAKEKDKQQKKIDKGKDSEPFKKTIASINKFITDRERKEKVLQSIKDFINSRDEMTRKLTGMNTIDNAIVTKKDVSEEELKQLAEDLNELREIGFESLVDFHMSAKEHTTKDEWDNIIKAFNKEIETTVH